MSVGAGSKSSAVFNSDNTAWLDSRDTQGTLVVPLQVLDIPALQAGDAVVLEWSLTVSRTTTEGSLSLNQSSTAVAQRYITAGDVPSFGIEGPTRPPDPRRCELRALAAGVRCSVVLVLSPSETNPGSTRCECGQ